MCVTELVTYFVSGNRIPWPIQVTREQQIPASVQSHYAMVIWACQSDSKNSCGAIIYRVKLFTMIRVGNRGSCGSIYMEMVKPMPTSHTSSANFELNQRVENGNFSFTWN